MDCGNVATNLRCVRFVAFGRSERSLTVSLVLAISFRSVRLRSAAEHGGVSSCFTPVHSGLLHSYDGALGR